MKYLFFMLLVVTIVSCTGEEVEMNKNVNILDMNDISENAWKNLSDKRIYFGHQSVGDNIIQGINDILITNNTIKLNIKHLSDVEISRGPVFIHSSVGENGHPVSKIEVFKNEIEKGVGDNVDIAFLKLCFWDIREDTDVNKLFNTYKSNLQDLQDQYPNIRFVHFTVPLMGYSNAITSNIKRFLNIDIPADLDNIKRNELNKLILNEYKGKNLLFDIASIESTRLNGTRSYFKKNGNKYYYLAAEYTDDGGHLNKISRKIVAEQLLITLANSN